MFCILSLYLSLLWEHSRLERTESFCFIPRALHKLLFAGDYEIRWPGGWEEFLGEYLWKSLFLVKFQSFHFQLYWERIPYVDVFLGFVWCFPGGVFFKASANNVWSQPHKPLFSKRVMHGRGTYVGVCDWVVLRLVNA